MLAKRPRWHLGWMETWSVTIDPKMGVFFLFTWHTPPLLVFCPCSLSSLLSLCCVFAVRNDCRIQEGFYSDQMLFVLGINNAHTISVQCFVWLTMIQGIFIYFYPRLLGSSYQINRNSMNYFIALQSFAMVYGESKTRDSNTLKSERRSGRKKKKWA